METFAVAMTEVLLIKVLALASLASLQCLLMAGGKRTAVRASSLFLRRKRQTKPGKSCLKSAWGTFSVCLRHGLKRERLTVSSPRPRNDPSDRIKTSDFLAYKSAISMPLNIYVKFYILCENLSDRIQLTYYTIYTASVKVKRCIYLELDTQELASRCSEAVRNKITFLGV